MDYKNFQITELLFLAFYFVPIILFLGYYLRARKQKQYLRKKILDKQTQLTYLENELKSNHAKVEELNKKYEPITDIERHCEEIIKSANLNLDDSERIRTQADSILNSANSKAKEIENNAKEKANNIIDLANVEAKSIRADINERLTQSKDKAVQIKSDAREEAEKTLSFAEHKAKEIAGDAYEAKEKADLYEAAIQAMKNTINGYKDDYIIPNHNILDDLADEFSHKEAGEELKTARKRIRALVKEGHAAECDYVENHRRMYAIHFAVDAFNGKVDSALSKVKHDNYGKIKQEIEDAFALVNHNGQPFRNARINQEYLEARLTELKWAVAAFELRKIEKEEQAAIKAQIREEERAIREMEKAKKEAEKEERLLQKALEQARKELKDASDDQKAAYENQLLELEAKLKEAEEKGLRAISMAQQTKRGHVYIISNIGSFGEKIFKIGMTRRLEPMDRVKELGDASVPFSFDVHAMIYSDNAPNLEKELHQKFMLRSVNKVNPRKEFFNISLSEVKQAVEHAGITNIHWTMKAEATEYRESLAIESQQKTSAFEDACVV